MLTKVRSGDLDMRRRVVGSVDSHAAWDARWPAINSIEYVVSDTVFWSADPRRAVSEFCEERQP